MPPVAFRSADYRRRAEAASALCLAIAEAHPDDAAVILDGVLQRMRRGGPVPAFEAVAAEAALWANFATLAELRAYLWCCWRRLPEDQRRAFLDHVQGAGA